MTAVRQAKDTELGRSVEGEGEQVECDQDCRYSDPTLWHRRSRCIHDPVKQRT
jgi:hypothetical protein